MSHDAVCMSVNDNRTQRDARNGITNCLGCSIAAAAPARRFDDTVHRQRSSVPSCHIA